MKCPYVIHRRMVTQSSIEYNEDGQQNSWTEVRNNIAEFAECKKENCGAWHRGKCCYNQNK